MASRDLAAGERRPDFWSRGQRWAHESLFADRNDTLLTIVALLIGLALAVPAIRWLVTLADFGVVRANLRLLLVGRFPVGEEWRIWIPVLLVTFLGAASWGATSRPGRRGLTLAVALSTIALVATGSGNALIWAASGVAIAWGGLAATAPLTKRAPTLVPRLLVVGWIAVWPLGVLLLVAFGGVPVAQWGGFYLNLFVTAVAAMGALPVGLALALARRGPYRVLRWAATGYIEVTRGLPLIVVLILSWLAVQRFLPSLLGLNTVGLLPRLLVAYIMFTAVYVAVAITGGLNGLPRGQAEACAALGMTGTQSMRLVLLPQAFRRALPSLAGELIDLLMSSTLISVLGLTDMLAAARATTEQPAFFGRQKEVLLFVGLLFWCVAFSLSRLSRRLERRLALGSGIGGR